MRRKRERVQSIEAGVRKRLGSCITEENELAGTNEHGLYLNWDGDDITIDGRLTVQDLIAIVWWVDNYKQA